MARMYKDVEAREIRKGKRYVAWRDMLQVVFKQGTGEGASGNEWSDE
jgi:hypothetical protein